MTKQERGKNRKDMFTLIEKWQESGTSLKEFCTQYDFRANIFSYWLNRNEGTQSISVVDIFMPVDFSSGESPKKDRGQGETDSTSQWFDDDIMLVDEHFQAQRADQRKLKETFSLIVSFLYYLYQGATDMRKLISGLFGILYVQLEKSPTFGRVISL